MTMNRIVDSALWADGELERLLLGDPTQARLTDPGTSHAAAVRAVDSKKVAAVIVSILNDHGPLIDEEIYRHAIQGGNRWTGERTRTVRAQLVRAGKVMDSGLKAKTQTGRLATEWMIR